MNQVFSCFSFSDNTHLLFLIQNMLDNPLSTSLSNPLRHCQHCPGTVSSCCPDYIGFVSANLFHIERMVIREVPLNILKVHFLLAPDMNHLQSVELVLTIILRNL